MGCGIKVNLQTCILNLHDRGPFEAICFSCWVRGMLITWVWSGKGGMYSEFWWLATFCRGSARMMRNGWGYFCVMGSRKRRKAF